VRTSRPREAVRTSRPHEAMGNGVAAQMCNERQHEAAGNGVRAPRMGSADSAATAAADRDEVECITAPIIVWVCWGEV
jgi:hypothetical protein